MFYATIGTGIGTGVVIDGQVYHGRTGLATEGGTSASIRAGRCVACGKRGCIEALAAGPAIARRAREKAFASLRRSHKEIGAARNGRRRSRKRSPARWWPKRYGAGDAVAKEVMKETLDLLAYWLGNVIDLLEPDVIVIGGGVSSMLAPFLEEIRDRWVGACLSPYPAGNAAGARALQGRCGHCGRSRSL